MGKAAIGILMLDTKFPRVLGDIGHTRDLGFSCAYARGPRRLCKPGDRR